MTIHATVDIDSLSRALAEMEELRLGQEAAQLRAAIASGSYTRAQMLVDFVLGSSVFASAVQSDASFQKPVTHPTDTAPTSTRASSVDAAVSSAAERAIVDVRLHSLERRVGTHERMFDFLLDADEEYL